MGSSKPLSALLIALKIFHVILALALSAASIWFFVEVQGVTSLRNSNHYRLNFNVYWPQAIPWVFLVVSVLVLIVSCCGFASAKKNSRSVIAIYIIFEVVAVLALIAATVIALVWADSPSTDAFIKDTMWDALGRMQTDREVEAAYGNIEKRFQCCGSDSPRDYINKRDEFPASCCDTYYHGWIGAYPVDCSFDHQAANERLGCANVVASHTRLVIEILSGVGVFTAVIGLVNVIIALTLYKSLRTKPQVIVMQHEIESKKVLL